MKKQKLMAMRKFRNFTQNEMAGLIAMEQTTYSRKERGISPITDEEWKRFAKALSTSVEEIKEIVPSISIINEIRNSQNINNEKHISLPVNLFNIMLKYTSKLEEDVLELKNQLKNKKQKN